eukprot:TRINITY_DN88525_c0_g1_i1.p1 TRINITY_DN88525_c0_g1~~TRINITY_DN88525_c0_g1_i1.p1  ORF type:complete len:286 (+),score=75.02 TRINITY_DN88525_c0_g1_i1:56-913(+)
MQQHWAQAAHGVPGVPVVRAAPVAHYAYAAHAAPQNLEAKKVFAATRQPAAGVGIAHACPAPAAVGAAAMTAAVLSAPTPSSNNVKIQPSLQNLPRFQPPDFEGADGQLPRPDSPCSTPRDDEAEAWNPNSPDEDISGPFAPGTFVEYKSRSTGQWVVGKVESFDVANQTYRLDVQPHAQADRVRARRSPLPAAAEDDYASDVARVVQRSHSPLHAREPPMQQQLQQQSLQEQVETLQRLVASLEAENIALQQQVMHEACLKDRYKQELAECQQHLQRQRGQTPR